MAKHQNRDIPLWVQDINNYVKNLSRKRKVEYKRWLKVHGPAWQETGRQLKEAFSPERMAALDALIQEAAASTDQPKRILRVIPGTIALEIE